MIPAFVLMVPRVCAAWPFLPYIARPGAVYQGPTGETVRVRTDGTAERVIQGGHPCGGVAEDPAAARRAP